MSSGCASASATASLVISWNSTRRILPSPLPFSWEATCQAIASPSRSGSVASRTRSAALAAFLISASVFAFSLIVTYFGAKLLSTSTPSSRLGRSRRWPTVAFTVYPRPKYFPIVLAFVGDSTMTSALPFTGAASISSGVASVGGASAFFLRGALAFFFGFTSSSLSGTHQPLVKGPRFALLPSGAGLRKPDDLRGHLIRRFRLGLHRGVRLRVERLARLHQLAHLRLRVITHQNGAGSRRRGARGRRRGRRFQVNDVRLRLCAVELARLRGPAAARRDHRGLVRERRFHLLALHVAKRVFALLGEDHGDRLAFFANQHGVDVHEPRVQFLGDEAADRRLAGARQADQHEVALHDAAPLGVRARTCAR